jgi:DNA-binding MarR family transcriptional regulator
VEAINGCSVSVWIRRHGFTSQAAELDRRPTSTDAGPSGRSCFAADQYRHKSMLLTAQPVDFTNPLNSANAARIGRSWIEMRRGAWTHELRDYLFDDDDPLEPGQMDALDLLARKPRTMKQFAERLRIEASTATRAVQRLVDDGLAERSASPEDGRVVMVRMTPIGRARHARVDARRARAMSLILGEFTTAEREQLADLLHRFVTSLDRSVEHLAR